MVRRRSSRWAAALAAAVLVAATAVGCAPGPSTPESTPTGRGVDPTPGVEESPEAEPSGAPAGPAVVIRSDRIAVLDDTGSEAAAVAYSSDAPTAIGQLTAALGAEPTVATVADDPCYPILDERTWGGLHIWTSSEGLRRPGSAQFYVTVDDGDTSTGVPIRTTTGQTVGDDQDDVLAANLESPSFGTGQEIDVHYDVASGSADGDPSQYWGAIAQLEDGELREIGAPVYYQREC